MIKKKKFSISPELSQGFTETVNAVKNNAGAFRYGIIGIPRIELDPNNPRELNVTLDDIKNGITKEDINYVLKQQELDALKRLSNTIKHNGIINPVCVYKNGEKYRLIAGERRYLASVLAQKEDIQAKILDIKPQELDIKLLQWVENTEREDLTLKDRISNVKQVIIEYEKANSVKVTAVLLKDLLGISMSQAANYINVMDLPEELKSLVDVGAINSLDKLVFLVSVTDPNLRNKLATAVVEGKTLNQLREMQKQIEIDNQVNRKHTQKESCRTGRAHTKINLGFTSNTHVARRLIEAIIKQQEYKKHSSDFAKVNWQDYGDVTNAFKKLISILENNI